MENLCMNCMSPLSNNEDICPNCNEYTDDTQVSPFIPKHTTIAERYIVGKGLEMDGEGLSYIGFDLSKNSKIYIREFYPSNLCIRGDDSVGVKSQSNCEKFFRNTLLQFLRYFRSIAKLRNLPSIVSVYDIVEENNTAYIICEWVEGMRLNKYLSSQGGCLDWDKAKTMFIPLLLSLSRMHAHKVRHLGICPDNILVTDENQLKLSGFATANLRSSNSIINNQLYDGCSALEQYLDHYEPSESTDVYGFTASLFLALTGEYPPSAPDREKHDKLMISQSILDNLPGNVVSAIATALRVYQNSRTISFETLKVELLDSPISKIKNIQDYNEKNLVESKKFQKKDNPVSKGNIWGIISCVIALVILLLCLGIYWFWLRDNSNIQKSSSEEQSSSVQNESETVIPQENLEDTSTNDENKIPVPNFVGRNFSNLQSELVASSDCRIALLSEDFHDSIGEGCIISQTPSPGEEMEKGAVIAVNVSKGIKNRILPEIAGKTLSEASQIIVNAKFVPKTIFEFNSEFDEGTVIGYKSFKAGDTVDYGSEVVIVISKGPE